MGKICHDAKAVAFANWSVWVKNLKCHKGARNDCTSRLELLCAKNRSKKHVIFEKKSILKLAKVGHDAKAIAFAKWSVWVKN